MENTTNWVRGTTALSRLSPELSKRARQRLQWIEHVQAHGNKSLTCRYFGISRPTLDRALQRYQPKRLSSLEDRASRPRRHTSADLERGPAAVRDRVAAWSRRKNCTLHPLAFVDHLRPAARLDMANTRMSGENWTRWRAA